MLKLNIKKNGAKIYQKPPPKSTPQLGTIWGPTWLHFDKVLGAKMEPSWHPIAPKIDFQIHQKIDHISDRSWDGF